ncbi:MAG: hypothetical protein IK115_11925 [Lachnospiraceae bacterium]|nr:hypothetical protein [Lachnospiraceae bacterium]
MGMTGESIGVFFLIARLLGFFAFIAILVVVAIVLIRSKRKRREQMNEQLRMMFEAQDQNESNGMSDQNRI